MRTQNLSQSGRNFGKRSPRIVAPVNLRVDGRNLLIRSISDAKCGNRPVKYLPHGCGKGEPRHCLGGAGGERKC